MPNPILHISRQALLFFILLLVVSANISSAETDPAFVRNELKTIETIWPGQRLTLYVRLFTTTSFAGSTRFELPGTAGMLIMESEDRPLLGTEKIDKASYIFKQHEIFLFPQHAGSVTVPSFEVEFNYRNEDGTVNEQSFTTDELQFTVEKIPETDPDRSVITTSSLRIDDHWQPAPGKARVGDAFTRTITMTADDLPGMAFPPLNVQEIEGIGLYSKRPEVTDRMQRGEFTGKRIETLTYVCERQGIFTIPEIRFQWWNPRSASLKNIVLKAVPIKVEANPLLQQESPLDAELPPDRRLSWKWSLLFLLFSLLAATVGNRLYRRIQRQRLPEQDRENELFAEFQKAAEAGDAADTMQALLHWLDYSNLTGSPGILERFKKLAHDPALDTEIEALETTLYSRGPTQPWSGDRLSKAVQQAGKQLKQSSARNLQQTLPPLNP